MRSLLALGILLTVMIMFILLVAEMPRFGNPQNPSFNYVYDRYTKASPDETGGWNLVNSIVLDYRGFDTLGETTVLFTSILAAMVTLFADGKHGKH